MELTKFIKNHQFKITLFIGYFLVFGLAFGLGRLTAFRYSAPGIRMEEVFSSPNNNSQNSSLTQSNDPVTSDKTNCSGKIKGNIGSGTKIYHMPGGAFYDRTVAEMCFDTETQAQQAGFRKSLR